MVEYDQQLPQEPSIYDRVTHFTHQYFGIEATHYIARLIEIHIRKNPELLSKEELMSLLDWIKSAATFFAEDKALIEKYINQLFKLASDSENYTDENAA